MLICTSPLKLFPRAVLYYYPWLTQPLGGSQRPLLDSLLGKLARERRWTVIIGGEHTNLGGVADRVLLMSGQDLLRRDLTVPPTNGDNSGPLRSPDIRGWVHSAILNRGASVQIRSLADRVLLAGDGWWAEPDLGEWLWVGDYVWNYKERSGRLALAASFDVGGARWVVIGDNSPLINSQIIADPRAVLRLIELASLWPSLASDTLIVALCLSAFLPSFLPRFHALQYAAIATLLCVPILRSNPTVGSLGQWYAFYVGQTGHDYRNFNVALAEQTNILSRVRVMRWNKSVSGRISLPKGQLVLFMLVDGAAELDGVSFSSCRRLGSLASSEGPRLMDAQACSVSGENARVLIGNRTHAAAVSVKRDNGDAIIILDRGFLGQNAPKENLNWLNEL